MSIRLVTLKTNHTILGSLDVDGGHYILKEPVQVIMQPTKEGPMMAFSPFLDYCEEFKTGIRIQKEDVLCVTTPMRELENQYNQVFGSGIQIASAIPKV
jgi:hypothetical protein